jgi:SAM-dependent methyltransferase
MSVFGTGLDAIARTVAPRPRARCRGRGVRSSSAPGARSGSRRIANESKASSAISTTKIVAVRSRRRIVVSASEDDAATSSSGGNGTSLFPLLPALEPWAAARVQKWASGWEKAAALTPKLPIPVLDLAREDAGEEKGLLRKLAFQTTFGAWVYDKGYRQMFRALGYPGPEGEAAMALRALNQTDAGRPIGGEAAACLDISCGPGIITAKIAEGLTGYDTLIASDYSDAMTRKAAEALDAIIAEDSRTRTGRLQFAAAKADVGDLPFAANSVAGAHASAAAHCWPDPKLGFREVARVLAPGGVFVTSTVVLAGPIKTKFVERGLCADAASYDAKEWKPNTPFWDTPAVVKMLEDAGLVDVEVLAQDKCFVMVKGTKPKQ